MEFLNVASPDQPVAEAEGMPYRSILRKGRRPLVFLHITCEGRITSPWLTLKDQKSNALLFLPVSGVKSQRRDVTAKTAKAAGVSWDCLPITGQALLCRALNLRSNRKKLLQSLGCSEDLTRIRGLKGGAASSRPCLGQFQHH